MLLYRHEQTQPVYNSNTIIIRQLPSHLLYWFKLWSKAWHKHGAVTRSNWTVWWSSCDSRACRSALWRCLCWAASSRRRRRSALGGTSWTWRWCSAPWWASGNLSTGSHAARGSALHSRAGRRAQRSCRSQTVWSTPARKHMPLF